MTRPWIIPVGGFLGAGKTTLILAAARLLHGRGLKCAAILNDQGADLVDSAFVEANGVPSGEVTGGCFCCRFSELIAIAGQLRQSSPDVIFIEPVGSCTDLAATILQPLKQEFPDYRLAPLTVVVNPAQNLTNPDLAFLFENQLAEADLVVSRDEVVPADWLNQVMNGALPTAGKLLTIDYKRYAQAEAALGWLNWSAHLHVTPALSPAQLLGPWVDFLQAAPLQIVHLKVFDRTPSTYLKLAIATDIKTDGDLTASPEVSHAIRFNLRAVASPQTLQAIFTASLAHLPGLRTEEQFQCFSPAAPQPERRYASA